MNITDDPEERKCIKEADGIIDNTFAEKLKRIKELQLQQKERAISRKTRYFVSEKEKASGKD